MKKARLELSKLNIPKFIELGKRMNGQMLNNLNFQNPPADLAQALVNATALETAYNKAKATNSKQEWENTRKYKAQLIINLRALASYIDEVAKGNEGIILSAGVAVNQSPVKSPAPNQVGGVVAEFTSKQGKILVMWAMARYARFYEVYMTSKPEDDNSWVLVNTLSGRKLLVENLATGTRYWFKVVAKGVGGVAPGSEAASQLAA